MSILRQIPGWVESTSFWCVQSYRLDPGTNFETGTIPQSTGTALDCNLISIQIICYRKNRIAVIGVGTFFEPSLTSSAVQGGNTDRATTHMYATGTQRTGRQQHEAWTGAKGFSGFVPSVSVAIPV